MAARVPAESGFRFGLRWLFALTTAVALCALVFRIAGRDEAIGIAIACLFAAIGWRFRPHGVVKRAAFALAGIAVWFSTVDYTWTVESCRHCHSQWSVFEVRILHQPIWSWKSPDDAVFAMVCEDLGSPCEHEVDRWQKWQLSGLIWPKVFNNGIYSLSEGSDWYSTDVRHRVRAIGQTEPHLGEELREALRSENHPAIQAIFTRIHAEAVP